MTTHDEGDDVSKPDWADAIISSRPRHTGDPELDALWNGTLGELDAILQDPEHPLRPKAEQVQDELFGPVIRSANAAVAKAAEQLNSQIRRSMQLAMPKLPSFKDAGRKPVEIREAKDGVGLGGSANAIAAIIDDVQVKPAAAATSPAEMRHSAEMAGADALRTIATASQDHLDHARDAEATRRAENLVAEKRSKRIEFAGWIAAVGGVLAAIGSIAAVIVGVLTLVASSK